MSTKLQIDMSEYRSEMSLRHKITRVIWHVVYILLFRPSPRLCFRWRNNLLKLFGSRLGNGVRIYPHATIFYPANLEMGDYAVIGEYVNCYNVDQIFIGEHAMVSPFSFLCSASHDCTKRSLPLITAPIRVEGEAWVCSDVYVGQGVTVGRGAVVGARSSVYKDVPPWTIVGGNPAKYIKDRVVRAPSDSADTP